MVPVPIRFRWLSLGSDNGQCGVADLIIWVTGINTSRNQSIQFKKYSRWPLSMCVMIMKSWLPDVSRWLFVPGAGTAKHIMKFSVLRCDSIFVGRKGKIRWTFVDRDCDR